MQISSDLQRRYRNNRRHILAKQIYYGDCLGNVIKKNEWLEYGLAALTGGTLLGILATFNIPSTVQTTLTSAFGLIAFFLSLIKARWNGARKIEIYNEFYTTYRQISTDLEKLGDLVRKGGKINDDVFEDKLASALNARKQIDTKEKMADPNVDAKLAHVKIQRRVDDELSRGNQTLEHVPVADRLRQTKFQTIKS